MLKRVYVIFLARLREFYRDKGSLAWNFMFPFFIIGSFYIIFTGKDRALFKVAHTDSVRSIEFFDLKYIEFVKLKKEETGIEAVRKYKIDMFIQEINNEIHFWINDSSPKGFILAKLLSAYSDKKNVQESIPGKTIRYVDWVLPGIIAMNMMYSCLWGVGYVIVRYREDEYLKRLKVTPLKAYEFLISQALARYVISIVVGLVLYVGVKLLIDFQMYGSYLLLLWMFSLGIFCFISLGLFVSSRITNKELMDGILNITTWPMLMFSGIFFSIEDNSPGILIFSNTLPLTHLVSSTRSIMLEGASFMDVFPESLYMFCFGCFFILLSHAFFKWT